MTVTSSRVSIMYFKLSGGKIWVVFFFSFISMFNPQCLLRKLLWSWRSWRSAPLMGTKWLTSNSHKRLRLCLQSMRKENVSVCGSLEDLGTVLPGSPWQMSAWISLAQPGSHDYPQTSHCKGDAPCCSVAAIQDHSCCWYHEYLLRCKKV